MIAAWLDNTLIMFRPSAFALVALAAVVAVICRVLPCRPATRHSLWLAVLVLFVVPVLMPLAGVSERLLAWQRSSQDVAVRDVSPVESAVIATEPHAAAYEVAALPPTTATNETTVRLEGEVPLEPSMLDVNVPRLAEVRSESVERDQDVMVAVPAPTIETTTKTPPQTVNRVDRRVNVGLARDAEANGSPSTLLLLFDAVRFASLMLDEPNLAAPLESRSMVTPVNDARPELAATIQEQISESLIVTLDDSGVVIDLGGSRKTAAVDVPVVASSGQIKPLEKTTTSDAESPHAVGSEAVAGIMTHADSAIELGTDISISASGDPDKSTSAEIAGGPSLHVMQAEATAMLPTASDAVQADAVESNSTLLWAALELQIGRWGVALARLRDALYGLPSVPAWFWLGGSSFGLVWMLIGAFRVRRALSRAVPADRRDVRLIRSVADELGLRRVPPVLMVNDCVSPMVIGGRVKRVILPRALWLNLDDVGRRAVLCHELAHVRRGDHIAGAWVSLLAILFWWHPVYWYARRQMNEEAELSCDAWVTLLMPDARRAYAEALLTAQSFVGGNSGGWVAAGGLTMVSRRAQRVGRRIKMVMTSTSQPRQSPAGLALVCALATIVWVTAPVWACPPEECDEPAELTQAETIDRVVEAPALVVTESGTVSTGGGSGAFSPRATRSARTAMRATGAAAHAKESGDAILQYLGYVNNNDDEPVIAVTAPRARGRAARASSDGHDGDLEERMERLERRLEILMERLEGNAPSGATGGMGGGTDGRSGGGAPAGLQFMPVTPTAPRGLNRNVVPLPDMPTLANVFADTGRQDYVIESKGKREALWNLMAISEVPVKVTSHPRGITVLGGDEVQDTFSRFVELLKDEEEQKRTYKVSPPVMEKLAVLMRRSDVPIFVETSEDSITVNGTASQQRDFLAFLNIIDPNMAAARGKAPTGARSRRSGISGGGSAAPAGTGASFQSAPTNNDIPRVEAVQLKVELAELDRAISEAREQLARHAVEIQVAQSRIENVIKRESQLKDQLMVLRLQASTTADEHEHKQHAERLQQLQMMMHDLNREQAQIRAELTEHEVERQRYESMRSEYELEADRLNAILASVAGR